MRLSREAAAQLEALRRHYLAKGRTEAARNLTKALRTAIEHINAGKVLPYPRPYPELAYPGEAWVHAGHYWFAHTTTQPVTIIAIFYDAADIPGRHGQG